MGLADYKEILGAAASTSSFSLLLAPALLCWQIWKRGSSKGFPFFPLMEGMARSVLLFQQGIVMGVRPMVITQTFGLALHLLYIFIYLSFTKDKSEPKKTILQWTSILVPIVAYANFEDKALVGFRYPALVTAFSIGLMMFHLYKVKDVIIKKDTTNLPLPILLAAFCVTFLWTLYGIAIDKPILQVQTGFACVVTTFELSLFVIYPRKPPGTKKQD